MMLIKWTMVLAAFVAVSMISYGAAAADTYTGCVTHGGILVKLAEGDTPKHPCRFGQTEITLHTTGNGNGNGGSAPRSGVFEFRGYSDNNMVDGGVGLVGMHGACQAEFPGEDARMCPTEEFFKSPGVQGPTTGSWVHPVFGSGSTDFVKASRPVFPCGDEDDWSAGQNEGAVAVGQKGAIREASCAVTCCARLQ